MTIKRRDIDIDISADEFKVNDVKDGKEKILKPVTKAAVAKKMLKKKIVPNKKTNFDEDGEVFIFFFLNYENFLLLKKFAPLNFMQTKLRVMDFYRL